jgi:hypothetical protein
MDKYLPIKVLAMITAGVLYSCGGNGHAVRPATHPSSGYMQAVEKSNNHTFGPADFRATEKQEKAKPYTKPEEPVTAEEKKAIDQDVKIFMDALEAEMKELKEDMNELDKDIKKHKKKIDGYINQHSQRLEQTVEQSSQRLAGAVESCRIQ